MIIAARRPLRTIGVAILFLTIALCLAATIVPRFLDRVYYRGPVSAHFDGEHFHNPDGDEDPTRAPGGGSRAGFFWRQATGADDRPPWPDRVPVRPATPAELLPRDAPAGAMRATWIGHASVLVQTPELNILTDPVWSDTAGPFGFGPRRVAPPGIRFEDLPRIDLVLVSHNHYDHLDLATLKKLWDRDHPTIVTPLGNDAILRSAGIDATALDWGNERPLTHRCEPPENAPDSFRCPFPSRVIVTRNHHWGSRWFSDRNRALWSSFVVTLPGGNLFFAGDTGFGDGAWADDAARIGPIRLALLPIGAFRFRAGQMASDTHVGPIDAVELFRRLGAQTALAVHWGTFRLSFEGYDTPPRLLRAALACSRIGQTQPWRRFVAVAIGRPVAVPPLPALSPPTLALPSVTRAQIVRCLDTPAVRALR